MHFLPKMIVLNCRYHFGFSRQLRLWVEDLNDLMNLMTIQMTMNIYLNDYE